VNEVTDVSCMYDDTVLMGSTWNYLDITALGRREAREDSPERYPQTPPYKWWKWHDAYADAPSPQ